MINFDFKKSLGQNFLNDENIIDKIVKYSEIDKDTLVIENDIITFIVNKLSANEMINNVDVLINGEITYTYNDNYDNISYNIDKSICLYGKNNISNFIFSVSIIDSALLIINSFVNDNPL